MDKQIKKIYSQISKSLKSNKKTLEIELQDISLEDCVALQNGLEEHYGFNIDVKSLSPIREVLVVDLTSFKGNREKPLKPVAFLTSVDYQYLEADKKAMATIIPFPQPQGKLIKVDFKAKKVLV